jgi:hypothetical protein
MINTFWVGRSAPTNRYFFEIMMRWRQVQRGRRPVAAADLILSVVCCEVSVPLAAALTFEKSDFFVWVGLEIL